MKTLSFPLISFVTRPRLPSVDYGSEMSNTVKCTKCNIVINEVLAFVCNKIDVMDEESICLICASAFTPSEITIAKNLLYESVPKSKKKIRKKEGKTQREIEDIICLLKDTDPECIPVFVARDLQKLPPVTFDHVDVTSLLKDIIKMKSDIAQFKECYASSEEIKLLKLEIDKIKNTSIANNQTMTVKHASPKICSQPPKNYIPEGISCASESKSTPAVEAQSNGHRPLPMSHQPNDLEATGHTALAANHNTIADIVRSGKWKEYDTSDEWKLVQKKKLRNRFIGKTGKAKTELNEKFKAAEINVPIYIYNVSKEVAVCHVTVEKINMRMQKDYDSYKIFVPKHKLDMFMNDDFWPNGVSYRHFVNFVPKKRVINKIHNDELQS